MAYLTELDNDTTEKLEIIQGNTPVKIFFDKLGYKPFDYQGKFSELVESVEGFRERIGSPRESDESIYKRMLKLYSGLPEELQTLGELE